VIDPTALQMVLRVLAGWLDRREPEAVAYLIEENRLLRHQLRGRCASRTRIAVGWPPRRRVFGAVGVCEVSEGGSTLRAIFPIFRPTPITDHANTRVFSQFRRLRCDLHRDYPTTICPVIFG
jgi:hypothetical protein